jgi:hypothetical protein
MERVGVAMLKGAAHIAAIPLTSVLRGGKFLDGNRQESDQAVPVTSRSAETTSAPR